MPNYTGRMQYLQSIYGRYHKASKEGKGRILDEFCKVCQYPPKASLRLLHRPVPKAKPPRLSRHRPFAYSPVVLQAAPHDLESRRILMRPAPERGNSPVAARTRKAVVAFCPNTQELLTISADAGHPVKAYKLALKRRFYSATATDACSSP